MRTLRTASARDERIDGGVSGVTAARLSVGSWVLYDASNTIFFTGITGLFFPLWVVNDMGGNDATVGFAVAAAMVANLLVAPVFGAMSDRAKRRLPFLALASMVGIAATFLMGSVGLNASLVLFGVAMVAMHTGVVIYNALMVEVSNKHNRGLIGGIGVGVGYLGALLAVAIGLVLVDEQGYVVAFRAIGVLMLVMTVPILILLRERPREQRDETGEFSGVGVLEDLSITIRQAKRYPGLMKFLIGRFWYYLAVQTAAIFAVLYGTETIGFTEREVQMVLLAGILVAIPSAPLWGRVVDRIGPFPTMRVVLVLWIFTLGGTVAIPWLDLSTDLWWVIGLASGVLVAGTWVTDRPILISLTRAEHIGQFFGLHSLTGRLGTIVGPFLWGFITVTMDFGQTASVVGLLGAIVLALYFVTRSGEECRRQSPS